MTEKFCQAEGQDRLHHRQVDILAQSGLLLLERCHADNGCQIGAGQLVDDNCRKYRDATSRPVFTEAKPDTPRTPPEPDVVDWNSFNELPFLNPLA
jgi:hypothetical protein